MIKASPRTYLSTVPEGWSRLASTYQQEAVKKAAAVPRQTTTAERQEQRFRDRLKADKAWAKREGLL